MKIIDIFDKDIFESVCICIVNPVNCVGVMGKGLAKQFKTRYPTNFIKYKHACDEGLLLPGKCLTVLDREKYIMNFPTKLDFRNPSMYEYIETGMDALIRHILHFHINSIAIPPLGCGLGGLNYISVKSIIIQKLNSSNLPEDLIVELYQ